MVAPLEGRQATLGTAQKMPRETVVPPKPRGREIRMPLATNAYSLQSEPLLAGDDINAILLPAMLKTAGHRVRLVTIASHPAAPEQFSHVYCEANVEGRWIPLDAARSGTRFGSAPSRAFRKRVWSLDADSYQDLRGLGCGACRGA